MYYNDYEDYMRNVLGYNNYNNNDSTYGCDNCYGMNYNNANNNCIGCNCGAIPRNQMNNMNSFSNRDNQASNIEQMYPEIYKIINPMVCRMCDNNTQPISEYMIEQMTDDIYDNVVNRVEIQNVINLNIGTTRDADVEVVLDREEVNNRNNSTNTNAQQNRSNVSSSNTAANNSTLGNSTNKTNISTNSKIDEQEIRETRSPQPRRRNTLLRDLIRILILNRLIRPGRPPFRPGPGPRPRPGFPGMPPRPPMPRTDGEYIPNDYFPYM